MKLIVGHRQIGDGLNKEWRTTYGTEVRLKTRAAAQVSFGLSSQEMSSTYDQPMGRRTGFSPQRKKTGVGGLVLEAEEARTQ